MLATMYAAPGIGLAAPQAWHNGIAVAIDLEANESVTARLNTIIGAINIQRGQHGVVASATSTPHLQALERHLLEKLEEEDLRPRPTAGQSPRWVVLDYGEVVVHLMTPEAREYYDLEGFWADAERL